MAYAMKRRNAGRPVQRKRRMKGKQSKFYTYGFDFGMKHGDRRGTQKQIRRSIYAAIREDGSAEEKRLARDQDARAMDFRQGTRDAAAALAGFKPSRGSDRDARIVSRAYDEDDVTEARRGVRSADGLSYRDLQKLGKELGLKVFGVKKAVLQRKIAKAQGGARANPRRNGTKKGMRRRTARRAYESNPRNFGAEFLFI
jgi:hypothetical protein